MQRVDVADCPALYCLRSDLPLLESGRDAADTEHISLLAPLDPLIYDRIVTAKLWGFSYTWEVYTPATRRVMGYYALPLLSGNEIAGHVDPRADRESKRLQVMSRSVRRGHRSAGAVRELAQFLGLRAPS